ncbi:hypothetical protein N9K47_00005 [bacterium]|nr:hypothetical protein [bacterium]
MIVHQAPLQQKDFRIAPLAWQGGLTTMQTLPPHASIALPAPTNPRGSNRFAQTVNQAHIPMSVLHPVLTARQENMTTMEALLQGVHSA